MGFSTSWAQVDAKLMAFQAGVHVGLRTAAPIAAELMKRTILAGAHGPKKSDSWVGLKVAGADFEAQLHGGFAYLTEKGSYKKPGGWEITGSPILANRADSFIATEAHHPAIAARPFWSAGFYASVPMVSNSYHELGIVAPMTAVFG